MTAGITSGQAKQVECLMRDAFDGAEIGKEGAQRLIERGGEFMAYVMAGIARYAAKPQDLSPALEILGDDFISPKGIAAARGLSYTEAQVAELGRTLPDREVLEWLGANGYMLVAGPPREMSLLDVRELHRPHFYSKEGGWYANEAFAREEKATCRWYMLRKGIVPDSASKTWGEQQAMVAGPERVPTAVELAWALTAYQSVRGTYLLGSLYARTSSVDSYGYLVVVGLFGADGLCVSGWRDGGRSDLLGLASARKC